MRYFIQCHIPYYCNLKCSYCFHDEWHASNTSPLIAFNGDQYRTWRDTHLKNDEIILHFAGGEPTIPPNVGYALQWFEWADAGEKFDILTNGLMDLSPFLMNAKKIHRIGITYHLTELSEKQCETVEEAAHQLSLLPITSYVKLLLYPDNIDIVLSTRERLFANGIDVKIQHFRPAGTRSIFKDQSKYINKDLLRYIDREYACYDVDKKVCSCRPGYKSLIIRHTGDVCACWHDDTPVGSVIDNTLDKNVYVTKLKTNDGLKPKIVRGEKMGDEKVVANGDLNIDLNKANKQELITAGYVVHERLDKLRAETMAMTSALELIRKRIKDIS